MTDKCKESNKKIHQTVTDHPITFSYFCNRFLITRKIYEEPNCSIVLLCYYKAGHSPPPATLEQLVCNEYTQKESESNILHQNWLFISFNKKEQVNKNIARYCRLLTRT